MGTVPIVIFRGLRQSHAQGHGELGTPHFPGYTPAWWNPKLNHLYKGKVPKKVLHVRIHFYFCFGTSLIVICHILLDLSIYGSNSQISFPDAIVYSSMTNICLFPKVDTGGVESL